MKVIFLDEDILDEEGKLPSVFDLNFDIKTVSGLEQEYESLKYQSKNFESLKEWIQYYKIDIVDQ